MAALEYVTNNKVAYTNENPATTTKQRIASALLNIPEPAAQSAALQLLKSKIALDKSFGLFLGLVGFAILEELI